MYSDRNYLVEKEAGQCLEKVRGNGGGWSKVGTGRFLKYHEAKPSEHRGPDAGGAGAVVGAHGSSFHLLPCSSRNRKQGREKRGRAAGGGAGSLRRERRCERVIQESQEWRTRRNGLWCPGSDGSPCIIGGHGYAVRLCFSVAKFTGTEETEHWI